MEIQGTHYGLLRCNTSSLTSSFDTFLHRLNTIYLRLSTHMQVHQTLITRHPFTNHTKTHQVFQSIQIRPTTQPDDYDQAHTPHQRTP